MADRFYSELSLTVGEHTIRGPEVHHLHTVRRFQPGDAVTFFHGDGDEYQCEIVALARNAVTIHVRAVVPVNRELPTAIHIYVAMPKGDRGDFLIEKLTELGVRSVTPIVTSRTIVTPKENRIENLRRAVIEASKQCGRNRLMSVQMPLDWRTAVTTASGERAILHTSATGAVPRAAEVSFAIGPEGGFTNEEVELAVAGGWQTMTLGPRVLRTETAAIAVASVIS